MFPGYTADGGVVDREEMSRRIRGVVEGDYAQYGFGRFAVECIKTRQFIGFTGLKFLPDYNFVDLVTDLQRAFGERELQLRRVKPHWTSLLMNSNLKRYMPLL